jgi:4-hydroxy-tetrahydrodipicolinate synthase
METKRYQWKGRWQGVCVFPITCFTPDYKVDYDAQRSLFHYLVESGVSGMGVNGHTGEGEVLTLEERKKIIKIAQEEVKGKIPISTGLHAHTFEEGIEQAKELEKTGVDIIMILSPGIYLCDNRQVPEYGIAYHKAIAKAINIPVVMHQVYGTVDEYPTDALVRMFREIDSLIGVKLANSWDTLWAKLEADMRALRAIGRDNISVFPAGRFLPTFSTGLADGTFTGYTNFGTKQVLALWNAINQNNLREARKIYNEELFPVEAALYYNPMADLIARYKEACCMLGLIPSSTVRPPKLPISDQGRELIREALIKVKLLPATK